MAYQHDDRRARAEALAQRRAEQRLDAPKAMQEYRAAEQSLRDRTKKLRQERLAREATQAKGAE